MKFAGKVRGRTPAGRVGGLFVITALCCITVGWAAGAAAPAGPSAALRMSEGNAHQAPRWIADLQACPAESGQVVTVECPPSLAGLPLPPMRVTLEGCPDRARIEVSPRPGAPFIPVYLRRGSGRLPIGVATTTDLRRISFRVQGASAGARLLLGPELPLVLTSAASAEGQFSFSVTNWSKAGDVMISARDRQGQEVPLRWYQGRLEPDASGWVWLGRVEAGGRASFSTDASPLTVYPITVKAKVSGGATVSETFFSPATSPAPGIAAPASRTEAATVLSGVINTYYPVTASVTAGATSIPVGTPSGAPTPISAGDVLILMQMQNAAVNIPANPTSSNYGDGTGIGYGYTSSTAGTYEYLTATGPVTGGSVPVQGIGSGGGTLNAYVAGAATASQGQQTAQVIRVPQYSDASIGTGLTCLAWNGSVGGVLAFDATNTLDLNGGIVAVDGLGFRGGAQMQLNGGLNPTPSPYSYYLTTPTNPPTGCFAMKGEGIAGTPRLLSGSNTSGNDGYPGGDFAAGGPGNAGGGGNDGSPSDNSQNAGGGGGSNGGLGGVGGDSWSTNLFVGGNPGGTVADSPSLLAMGGGGGAGTRNNITAGGDASGAVGGGIVIVRALAVTGAGSITANGANAPTSEQDAAGGGGAGGAILVSSATGGLGGLTVTANGGQGGNAWPLQDGTSYPGNRHGPGGGGGGGAIFLSQVPLSATANGGASGITTTSNDPYGADSGLAGHITFGINSGSIPGPGLGGGTTYITKSSSAGTGYASPGQTLTYTVIVSNPTSSTWTNVAVADPLPPGTSAVPGSTQVSTTTVASGTYADNFAGGRVYTDSSGSLTWAPSWIESNDGSGSPTRGYIQVVSDPLSPTGYSLRLSNTSRNNSSVARAADLSIGKTVSAATISVSYRRYDMGTGESVTLDISPDGTNWTPIRTYSGYTDSQGNNVTDSGFSTETFAIPASFLTSTFQLEFQGPTLQGRIYFDNVTLTCFQQQTTTQTGSDPATLVSGYTLAPGQALTITYQVVVNSTLDPSITAITNTATVTADGGINQSATVTNPVLPAPTVSGPIFASSTAISGTSSVIGGTITVYQNGNAIGSTTVQSNGTWSLTGVSGLVGGASLTATVSSSGATSGSSAAVIVQTYPALLRVQWTTLQSGSTTAIAPPNPATVFPNDTLPIPPNTPSDPALASVVPYPLANFQSGASFTDQSNDATDTTPQVVFYQLQGDTTDILKVAKGKDANSNPIVVITYGPP